MGIYYLLSSKIVDLISVLTSYSTIFHLNYIVLRKSIIILCELFYYDKDYNILILISEQLSIF